jgi:hypothetical protein
MSLGLMLILQAAAPPPVATPLRPIGFDLAALARRERCTGSEAADILVCGRRPEGGVGYPLEEMERRYRREPLVAETRLFGNVIGDVHVESAPLDRGAVSKRVMVRVRIPF